MAAISSGVSSSEMTLIGDRFCESEPLLQTSQHCFHHENVRTDEEKEHSKTQVEGQDGYSAWVVAAAAMLSNTVIVGFCRLAPILFVEFRTNYGMNRGYASLPSSVQASTRNLLGPLIGILGQKYGARRIIFMGTILAALSTFSCHIATRSAFLLAVFWGLGYGMGLASSVSLSHSVIGEYFGKHETTASGMAYSGGCIGSFIFPTALRGLIRNYGLERTFLIMGTVLTFTLPLCVVFRRPHWLEHPNQNEHSNATPINRDDLIMSYGSDDNNATDLVNEPSTAGNVTKFPSSELKIQVLRRNCRLAVKMLRKVPLSEDQSATAAIHSDASALHFESGIRTGLEDLLRRIEIFHGISHNHRNSEVTKDPGRHEEYAISSCDMKEQNSCSDNSVHKSESVSDLSQASPDLAVGFVLWKLKRIQSMTQSEILVTCSDENRRSVLKVWKELRKLYNHFTLLENSERMEDLPTIPADDYQQGTTTRRPRSTRHPNSFSSHVKTMMTLFRNRMFLLICLSRAVHFLMFFTLLTIVADVVIDIRLPKSYEDHALEALSVGDFLGRVCVGWVTDKNYVDLVTYMKVVMIAQALSTALLAWMSSKSTLFLFLGIFSLLEGSLIVRHPVLVSKYLEEKEQFIAIGCMNFFSGILGFCLPVYIGYCRDILGSYKYIFYGNAVVGCLVGLIWWFIPCCQCSPSHEVPQTIPKRVHCQYFNAVATTSIIPIELC